MMQLFLLTILIIFYIVLSNNLILDERVQKLIDSFRYSNHIIVFILALMTLYIQNPTLGPLTYMLVSIGVVMFFYITPFIKLNRYAF